QRARVAVDDDLGNTREALRGAVTLPLLRAVVLHHPRPECIGDPHQRRLRATERLRVQRPCVVRLLAYRVVEQDRAHLTVYCTGSVAKGMVRVSVAEDSGLSACIITLNEADRIEACLRSVDFCDEIIVVDAHSTDRTRELAAALGARVIERDWPGYRSQKQFAVDTARHDWVLCLDADERVSAELRTEIAALRRSGGRTAAAGWSIPRITDYFGRFLRHGNAYPDRLVRLFDRRCGGWIGYEIHENTRVVGRTKRLHGHLEHYSYRSLN